MTYRLWDDVSSTPVELDIHARSDADWRRILAERADEGAPFRVAEDSPEAPGL